jgi:hypothetical protein
VADAANLTSGKARLKARNQRMRTLHVAATTATASSAATASAPTASPAARGTAPSAARGTTGCSALHAAAADAIQPRRVAACGLGGGATARCRRGRDMVRHAMVHPGMMRARHCGSGGSTNKQCNDRERKLFVWHRFLHGLASPRTRIPPHTTLTKAETFVWRGKIKGDLPRE